MKSKTYRYFLLFPLATFFLSSCSSQVVSSSKEEEVANYVPYSTNISSDEEFRLSAENFANRAFNEEGLQSEVFTFDTSKESLAEFSLVTVMDAQLIRLGILNQCFSLETGVNTITLKEVSQLSPQYTYSGTSDYYKRVYNFDFSYRKLGTHKRRPSGYNDFKINSLPKVYVNYGEDLVFVAEQGYCPVPKKGSQAEALLYKAKSILNDIVNDDMSEYEKYYQIYSYVSNCNVYDFDSFHNAQAGFDDGSSYIDGLLDKGRGICDGLAKLNILLCRLEGIECYRAAGQSTVGGSHAYNYVKIDGTYYVSCTTRASTELVTPDDLFHNGDTVIRSVRRSQYFLTSYATLDPKWGFNSTYWPSIRDKMQETTPYDYWAKSKLTIEGKEHTLKPETANEMKEVLDYVHANQYQTISLEVSNGESMAISFLVTSEVYEAFKALTLDYKTFSSTIPFDSSHLVITETYYQ